MVAPLRVAHHSLAVWQTEGTKSTLMVLVGCDGDILDVAGRREPFGGHRCQTVAWGRLSIQRESVTLLKEKFLMFGGLWNVPVGKITALNKDFPPPSTHL